MPPFFFQTMLEYDNPVNIPVMIAQRTAEVEVALFFFIEFRITGSGHIEDAVIGFDKKLDKTAGVSVFSTISHKITEPFKFADIFPNVLFPLEKIVDKRIICPFSAALSKITIIVIVSISRTNCRYIGLEGQDFSPGGVFRLYAKELHIYTVM